MTTVKQKVNRQGKRASQHVLQWTGIHNPETDKDFEDTCELFNLMAKDLNELGAGIFESLKDTKQSFTTNEKLARVVDKFYNGEFKREWPCMNSMQDSKHQQTAQVYKTIWENTASKIRPSAAFICIEKSLNHLREFEQKNVPSVKARVRERYAAELDKNVYIRRAKKQAGSNKLPATQEKLSLATETYDKLNNKLKEDLLREKMTRDVILEESMITLIVCQLQMYKELTKELQTIVESFPQKKVVEIESKILNLVVTGGPKLAEKKPDVLTKAGMVVSGMATVNDFVKSEDQINEEKLQQQNALAAHTRIAKQEEAFRANVTSRNLSSKPQPPKEELVEALYDCVAEDEGDLSFKKGDVITVKNKMEGWWEGSLNGMTGVFPANYVQPYTG